MAAEIQNGKQVGDRQGAANMAYAQLTNESIVRRRISFALSATIEQSNSDSDIFSSVKQVVK
jgi:hypothetical protein